MNQNRPGWIVGIWLAWMSLMFFFSTQFWGGAHTRSWLELLLRLSPASGAELVSRLDLNQLNFLIRKAAHFTEYAVLATLGFYGWSRSLGQPPVKALRYALGCAILFAISDEFHQRFEPGRESLLTDVLIDVLGASVATLALWVTTRRSPAASDAQ